MRLLILLAASAAAVAGGLALAIGFVEGEFDTPSEGVTWLRALVEQAMG
jgi:hypothetical protein